MTFGLPQNLAPRLVSKSFHRAAHFAASIALAAGAIILIATEVWEPTAVLWPAALALIPFAIILFLLDRRRTPRMAFLYLAAGAAVTFIVTFTCITQLPPEQVIDLPGFQYVKIATLLVGGTGPSRIKTLVWGTSGYAVAEASAALAILVAGAAWRFDPLTAGAYLGLMLLAVLFSLNGARGRRIEARLRRAAHDDVAAAVVFRVEQRASAILHDTVLNHLTAIALTPDARLSPVLASQLERDLQLVEGATLGESLSPVAVSGARSAEWAEHPVHDAVRAARASGLDVDVTGDPEACVPLSPRNADVAALAITQCLVNVTQHSGVSEAELVIHPAGDDVMFMVIDGGAGFDQAAVDLDRLGIRNSIRARIESIGGSVQLWTGVGTGTSVVIQVPIGDTEGVGPAHTTASEGKSAPRDASSVLER